MKPGRNDPCPCGSGKKYKHCCANLSLAPSQTSISQYKRPAPDTFASEQNRLIALYQTGRYAELENQANLFLRQHPDSGFGWKILSAALVGQNKDAFVALQKAAKLLPQDAQIHNNLGDLLAKQGKLNEAEKSFRTAIEINPQYSDAHFNLGAMLMQRGILDKAVSSYRKTLEITPECTDARYFLAQMGKVKADDPDFKSLIAFERKVQDKAIALQDEQSMYLHFAMGKSLDDIGESEQAFRHFTEGNRLKRKTLQYDSSSDSQVFSEIMRIFDAATLEKLRGAGNTSQQPVFIVGMPRSGTTLTEQIISSHPEVHGAGELTDLTTIMQHTIADTAYPENLRLLDRSRLSSWANDYMSALRKHNPSALRITDKLPGNFLAIGLIHVMLPNARIIHVKRDPVDTCLSCFANLFTQQNVKWTYDLTELGSYYSNYARLMEHWRNVLPAHAMLEVKYEDLISNQEEQTRRMIQYCGLPWNDNCLAFHQNKRAVRTVSMTQVRQPVYNTSVARWHRYANQLEPLLKALGNLVTDRKTASPSPWPHQGETDQINFVVPA